MEKVYVEKKSLKKHFQSGLRIRFLWPEVTFLAYPIFFGILPFSMQMLNIRVGQKSAFYVQKKVQFGDHFTMDNFVTLLL